MQNKKYKWGIIAPGHIANKFATGLSEAERAEFYAVASRDINRAEDFAKKFGFAKAYGSYKELAEDDNVDIVYIATPHSQHMDATLLCLEHGKAVICEKPLAVNAAQARRMIECARKNKTFLMEAVWSRLFPAMVKTRELLASGAIGKPRHINAEFCFAAGYNPASRLYDPALAGGSLLDVGVYNLNFSNMVFGRKPEKMQSHIEFSPSGVDETACVMLSYGENQTAQVLSSVSLNASHDAVIYGDEGNIRLPSYWCGNTVILNSYKDGVQEFSLPYESTGYQFEAIEVMECLDKGLLESPVMPLAETLEVMEMMDKIRYDNGFKYPFE